MKQKKNLNNIYKRALLMSYDIGLINFGMRLSGVSLPSQIEILLEVRKSGKDTGQEILSDFKDARRFLVEAGADCGTFSKAFFDFLTDSKSNINEIKAQQDFDSLKKEITEIKDYPYVIQISVPGHQYVILVTHQEENKPQGQIYQTNTHPDLEGEKFNLYQWLESKNNKMMDVTYHLNEINSLLNPKEKNKKEIFEKYYSIPLSERGEEIKTNKKLTKLIKDFSQPQVRWLIGKINHKQAFVKLRDLSHSCLTEMDALKAYFNIAKSKNFVDEFTRKLDLDEITLEYDFTENFESYLAEGTISLRAESAPESKQETGQYAHLKDLSITIVKSSRTELSFSHRETMDAVILAPA